MTERLEQFVRKHAQKQRLTLSELAQRAGMSRQSLYGLWQSKRHPNLGKLIELAQALQVHPLRLFEQYLAVTLPEHHPHNGVLDVSLGDDRTHLLESFLENASEGIIGIDSRQEIVVYNLAAEKLLRTPAHKVRHAPVDSLLPRDAVERLLRGADVPRRDQRGVQNGTPDVVYLQLRCGDQGEPRTLAARATQLHLEEGPLTLLWIHPAGTDTTAAEGVPQIPSVRSDHALSREPQTGLPDPGQLDVLTARAAAFANWLETGMALVILDLEALRRAAGNLGSQTCRQLLRAAADCLQGALRHTDRIALADDAALALILPGLTEHSDARALLERLRRAVTQSEELRSFHVDMTPRAGAAFFPEDAQSPQELRHLAWAALEAAQRRGEAACIVDRPLAHGVAEQVALLRDLQGALERDELSLRYEPIHDLNSGRCVALEALVCWEHPKQGRAEASTLFQAASQAGLEGELMGWTIDRVFRDLPVIAEQSPHWPRIAINATGAGLLHHALAPTRLSQGLSRVQAPPGMLEVEVSEYELADTDSPLTRRMQELREQGIRVAIDHFGLGHAPLFALPHLPVDRLKIRCPAVGQHGHPDQLGLASIVARLAVQSQLMLSAIGVDSQQAATHLHNLGFDEAQGPYFAAPLAAGDLAHHLQAKSAVGS